MIEVKFSSNSSSNLIKIKYGSQKQHQQESLGTLGWAQFVFFKLRLAYQDVGKPRMQFFSQIGFATLSCVAYQNVFRCINV